MLNEIYDWYGGQIPSLHSVEFPAFLGRSVRLIQYITGMKKMLPALEVRFNNWDTAGCDPATNQVWLPSWPLSHAACPFPVEGLEELTGLDRAAMVLALYNGFIVHEAHHLKHTPPMKTMLSMATTENVNESALSGCIQIVEDLYIDHQAFPKPYGIFLQMLSDVLLGHKACLEGAERLRDNPTIGNMLNLLATYKNPRNRDAEIWTTIDQEIVRLMKQAFTAHQPRARAKIAYELYQRLNDDDELDKAVGRPQIGTSHDVFDSEENHQIITKGDVNNNLVENIQGEVTAELKQMPNEDGNVPSIKETPLPQMRYPTKPDSSFRGLGNILRMLQTTNWTYGTPRKFGSRILPTRLSRARTDGKVFGIPRPKDSAVETEVLLLIDASGSMNSIIESVVAAAYGSYLSIRQARLRCGVYAHTSGRNEPLLFPVVELGASPANVETQFSRVLSIYRNENFDGFAIEATAKKFSRRDGEKVLLVFSDGRPNGPNYRGEDATQHTAQTIKRLRKAGYRIISISLQSSVMRTNDKIYGTGFNVNASGAQLVPQLKAVIQRIAAGEI